MVADNQISWSSRLRIKGRAESITLFATGYGAPGVISALHGTRLFDITQRFVLNPEALELVVSRCGVLNVFSCSLKRL